MKVGLDHLHGYFSRDLPPALTVDPGATVRFECLDAGWGNPVAPAPFAHPGQFERDASHFGHALTGPVAIRGAQPGQTLEIRIDQVVPGNWGWSSGDRLPSQFEGTAGGPPAFLTVPEDGVATLWELREGRGYARQGWSLGLRPFMGVMGMPEDCEGVQTTFPPRCTGGNLDCKELVAGTTLYLPIAVAGGLFSTGDGHAVQGNGEMAGPALACPMTVELTFNLLPQTRSMPRARTPAGWLTFGCDLDLERAWRQATEEMLALMTELYPLSRKEALGLSSLVVDLSLTQVVNGVRGVHAFLPHDALTVARSGA